MAYRINSEDGDIIIDGFDKGIGASPLSGLTDLKNVNIDSVPGEASAGFQTSSKTQAPVYTDVSASAFGDGFGMTVTGLTSGSRMEIGQAISVSASTISGFTVGTLYYITATSTVTGTSQVIQVDTGYGSTSQQAIGTTGTATISVIPMILGTRGNMTKNYFAESRAQAGPGSIVSHWLLDKNGRVWSDTYTTAGGTQITSTSSWTYTGNTINGNTGGVTTSDGSAAGNGLVYFSSQGTNGTDGWLFVFRNKQIDYLKVIADGSAIVPTSLSWVYGWNPATGAPNQSNYLTNNMVYGATAAWPHEAIVTPGGLGGFVNYCDSYYIGQFSQFSRSTPFNPQTPSTYNWAKFPVLPANDVAQCLSYDGSRMLIGGLSNIVYPWDLVSNFPSAPLIQLPENNTTSIVSVNQNSYLFTGNRGKIYITNGSQANLWKKVPDHISGVVQPLFAWGGVAYSLNKLYFGIYINQTPSSPAISSTNNYGGVWAVDLDSNSIYLSNVLSDGVYTGYTPVIFGLTNGDADVGYQFYAGWTNSFQTSSGVDITVGTPYSGGQSIIVSDLIPIGTSIEPITPAQFEYKLSMPLLVNESVELQIGSSMADYVNNTFTSLGTTTGTGSATSGTIFSDIFSNQRQTMQWLLVKAILTSTGTNPSYTRLTGLRVKGATVAQSTQSNYVTE